MSNEPRRVGHASVCIYALIDPAYAGLRPGSRSGFLGGQGVADMKGNFSATRRMG
jgi:hypothetical protein